MKCHKNDEDYEITDEQAMMSPSRVRGFSLSEKQWAFFLVENAKHIEWGESLFDELELKGPLKRTIKSLVETHYDGVQAPDSGHALARKGKGLVILLYGPTGTGKTLTAGEFRLKRLPKLPKATKADNSSSSRKCRRSSKASPGLYRSSRTWTRSPHNRTQALQDSHSCENMEGHCLD